MDRFHLLAATRAQYGVRRIAQSQAPESGTLPNPIPSITNEATNTEKQTERGNATRLKCCQMLIESSILTTAEATRIEKAGR